ncbi:MAG: helix-hairpin-helix domain-containing protein, partial [Bacteroidales bacterium]
HHRSKREKALTRSELTQIDGVGEKTLQALLKKFKSVNNIKKATLEELQKIVGKAKGKIVFEYFNSLKKSNHY